MKVCSRIFLFFERLFYGVCANIYPSNVSKKTDFLHQIAEALHIREAVKFTESGWKSLWYTISFAWGCSIVFGSGWFPHIHLVWEDLKGHPILFNHRLFQIVELGFYFHSLFAHFFLEVHRSDYWAMLFHHIVTIFLILTSYIAGYASLKNLFHTTRFYRMGIVVLVVHDINDVIFEAGKLLLYQEKKNLENLVNGIFGLFVLVWAVARLGVFPFVVIRTAFVHAPHYFQYHSAIGYCVKSMILGLLFLEILHIYWFVLIGMHWGSVLMVQVRVMQRALTGKVLDDPRETKEKMANNKKVQ